MTKTELVELYNGEVRMLFYPKSHKYKIEGEKKFLPSSTKILKIIDRSGPLMHWAVNLTVDYLQSRLDHLGELDEQDLKDSRKKYIDERDKAADIGTAVHDFAEAYALAKINKTKPPKISDDLNENVLQGIYAFLDWFTQNKVEFLVAERIVYSKKLGYVGRLDAIAIVNEKKILIDYKTSSGVYSSAHMQAVSYKMAYEEETGDKLYDCIILHFDKNTGEFYVHSTKKEFGLAKAKKGFKSAFDLWKIEKGFKFIKKSNQIKIV